VPDYFFFAVPFLYEPAVPWRIWGGMGLPPPLGIVGRGGAICLGTALAAGFLEVALPAILCKN